MNVLWGGEGDDTITGGDSAENRLHGQGGNDILTGGDGVDFIRGLEGENTIDGRGGNDLIIAGGWAMKISMVGPERIQFVSQATLPISESTKILPTS